MTRAWREPVSWLAEPVPMMKVGASLFAVGVACGLLWLGDQREGSYYQAVAGVLANSEKFRGKRLRMQGYVACGSIRRRVGSDHYRFKVEDDHVQGGIEARYTGRLPDLFASGKDVVVQGRLCADGSFDVVEGGIMTRCPARYDGEWPSPLSRCPTVSPAAGEAF